MLTPDVSYHLFEPQPSVREEFGRTAAKSSLELVFPRQALYVTLKSLVESVAGLVLLLMFSPLILAAAALVVMTSRGPAFYCQTRLGLRGRKFKVYKLRSMVQNAEAATGATWCQVNDTRITPVGRILRETHIDELPQLINVVLGHM